MKLRVVVGKEKAAEAIKSNEEFKEAFDGTYGFVLDLNNPLPALRKILDDLGDSEKQQKTKIYYWSLYNRSKHRPSKRTFQRGSNRLRQILKSRLLIGICTKKLFEATGSKEFANKAYDGIMIFDELSKA